MKASKKQCKPQASGRSLHSVVGTPRVNSILSKGIKPLANAGTQEEFSSALKTVLQELIKEAKALEEENQTVKYALSQILDGIPMRYPTPCSFTLEVSHLKVEAARAAVSSSNPVVRGATESRTSPPRCSTSESDLK